MTGRQWLVTDLTRNEIRHVIERLLSEKQGGKLFYCITDANEDDVEKYGGIQEDDVVEHVLRHCIILDTLTTLER